MIYIIFNNSYEWSDLYNNDGMIVYCGTSKEAALANFDKWYSNTPNMDNNKWHYVYELWEFPDEYNVVERNDKAVLIKSFDNVEE